MIKLTATQERNFREKFIPLGPDDCWVWTHSTFTNGYGSFGIGGRSNRKSIGAHQVSFFLEHKYLPAFVLHTCHNKSCVNPAHLYDGTKTDNLNDMYRCGGKSNTLTCGQRQEIFDHFHACRFDTKQLAEMYGIARTNIYQIINGNRQNMGETT